MVLLNIAIRMSRMAEQIKMSSLNILTHVLLHNRCRPPPVQSRLTELARLLTVEQGMFFGYEILTSWKMTNVIEMEKKNKTKKYPKSERK